MVCMVMDMDITAITIHTLHTLNMTAPTMPIMLMERNMGHMVLITTVMITISLAEAMTAVVPLTAR